MNGVLAVLELHCPDCGGPVAVLAARRDGEGPVLQEVQQCQHCGTLLVALPPVELASAWDAAWAIQGGR